MSWYVHSEYYDSKQLTCVTCGTGFTPLRNYDDENPTQRAMHPLNQKVYTFRFDNVKGIYHFCSLCLQQAEPFISIKLGGFSGSEVAGHIATTQLARWMHDAMTEQINRITEQRKEMQKCMAPEQGTEYDKLMEYSKLGFMGLGLYAKCKGLKEEDLVKQKR